MIKQMTIGDLCNLEGSKLLYDAGYRLDISIKKDCLILTYRHEYATGFDAGTIEIYIFLDGTSAKVFRRSRSNDALKEDLGPAMYPIMKILEELKIDIEKIYFDKIKKDDIDE